jgi:hypothetical protein
MSAIARSTSSMCRYSFGIWRAYPLRAVEGCVVIGEVLDPADPTIRIVVIAVVRIDLLAARRHPRRVEGDGAPGCARNQFPRRATLAQTTPAMHQRLRKICPSTATAVQRPN